MSENTGACFVYFIAAGWGPIKIGVSSDPSRRLADLATSHYKPLRILYPYECRTREVALLIEDAFHRWYGERRLRNEWFDIKLRELIEDIKLFDLLVNESVSAKWIVDHEAILVASINQSEQEEIRATEKKRATTGQHRATLSAYLAQLEASGKPRPGIRTIGRETGIPFQRVSELLRELDSVSLSAPIQQ
jgi:predicted GIY-YIG superfamily endonuclease